VNFCLKEAFCKLATVRIFIVDDSEPWRRAVRLILKQHKDLEIICEASDGLEAVQKSAQLQPDLILLDIGLPNLNGLEAARQIRNVSPDSRILFVTGDDTPEVVEEALRIGALGYVIKLDTATDLMPALRAVMRNRRFVRRHLCPISWLIQDS